MSERQKATGPPEFPKSSPVEWVRGCLEEIDRLGRLAPDWNSYGADPPNATALFHARQVLDVLEESDFAPDRIVASAEGGVAVSFLKGNRYSDLECMNSGEVLAALSDRRGTPEVWEVDAHPTGMKLALDRIREFLAD